MIYPRAVPEVESTEVGDLIWDAALLHVDSESGPMVGGFNPFFRIAAIPKKGPNFSFDALLQHWGPNRS
jgi:hypothetical protein